MAKRKTRPKKPTTDVEIGRLRGRGILVLTRHGRLVEKTLSVGLTGHDEPEWGLCVVDVPVPLSKLAETLGAYAVSRHAVTALRKRLQAR